MRAVSSAIATEAALGEADITNEELARVHEQAARGDYGGTPLRFLAGVEIEAQFQEIPGAAWKPEALKELRQVIRDEVTALEPQSDEQAATRQLWLDQIPGFNAQDIFNHHINSKFSHPTLEPGNCPTGLTYDEVVAHTAASGLIAFRYGQKPYQWSYYDHPAVSEWRLNPTSPLDLRARANRIMRYILDEAAYNGLELATQQLHTQLSVSAYRQSEDGKAWLPVLGVAPEQHATTSDALAGISAGLEDGAWFSSALMSRQYRYMFHPPPGQHVGFSIGTSRTDPIRLAGNRTEVREDLLAPTITQGLLWIMASISYGLEKGAAHIASQPGRSAPELIPTPVLTATERYDASRHHLLKRMIQYSAWQADILFGDQDFIRQYGQQFAEQLTGRTLNAEAAQTFCKLFLHCIEFDKEGRLDARARISRTFQAAANSRLSESAGGPEAMAAMLETAAGFLREDALRAHIESHPTATAHLSIKESVAAWMESMRASEIVRRAYGERLDAYTKFLGALLAHHDIT